MLMLKKKCYACGKPANTLTKMYRVVKRPRGIKRLLRGWRWTTELVPHYSCQDCAIEANTGLHVIRCAKCERSFYIHNDFVYGTDPDPIYCPWCSEEIGWPCQCGGKYFSGGEGWPSRMTCHKCGDHYDLGGSDKEGQYIPDCLDCRHYKCAGECFKHGEWKSNCPDFETVGDE